MNIKTRPSHNNMKRRTFRKGGGRSDQRRSSNGYNGNGNGSFESDNSDGKMTKKAQGAREKYLGLARDALSDGDRVLAENYLQHADHYLRILNEAGPSQTFQPRPYNNERQQLSENEGNRVEENNEGKLENNSQNSDAMPLADNSAAAGGDGQKLPGFARPRYLEPQNNMQENKEPIIAENY